MLSIGYACASQHATPTKGRFTLDGECKTEKDTESNSKSGVQIAPEEWVSNCVIETLQRLSCFRISTHARALAPVSTLLGLLC